jgi:type I restriction enzyme S subunit
MEYLRVGDCFDIIKGKKVEQLNEESENSIRYIQIDDLRNDNNIKYCLPDEKYVIAKKNDIIIAWDGANAGTIGYGLEGAIGSTLAILRWTLEDKVCTSYVGRFLQSKSKYLRYKCTGATIPHVSKESLENILIPVPDLQTQHKIVQVLDKAQSLIDKRKEQIKQCDELIQSLFYDMFGTMDIFKTKWEIKKLKDIANYHIGLTYKPSEICDDGIIVLRASNIQNGRIVLDDIVRVNKNIKSELLVKKGDILMCSRSGSASLVGKAALIPDLNEKMSFGAFMTIIRSDYNVYLLNYIRSSAFRSQIRSGATTTINQITLKMLDNIEVPLPPLELQNLFAEKVQKIEHQKQLLQQSLSLLEDNFNSLMQKAFKGELFQ